MMAHSNKLNSATFNSDGNVVLTAGRDSSIKLWDLRYLVGLTRIILISIVDLK